jgi:hypothetical protein
LALADVAGLRDAVLLNEWGAAQFRDMLDTGGEAHRRALEAMRGAAGEPAADQSSAEDAFAETNDAPFAPATAFEKKAGALMDAVALGAPADAKAETSRSWDAVRGAVAEQYEQGGLEAYAAFVRGA